MALYLHSRTPACRLLLGLLCALLLLSGAAAAAAGPIAGRRLLTGRHLAGAL
jgi:hypothetical protein